MDVNKTTDTTEHESIERVQTSAEQTM